MIARVLIVCVGLIGYGAEGQSPCANEWKFMLYTTAYPNGTTDISQADASRPTVIIIHSWEQCASQSWIIAAKNAHLSIESRNVITLDWSKDAMNPWYPSAAEAVPEVGTFLGETIYEWVQSGTITVASTRLVGLSLGAHVCAFAGQVYQSKAGGQKLPYIIALDPVKFLFQSKPLDERLDASDATMVQVFHTSYIGMSIRCGTVDVYFSSEIYFLLIIPIKTCGTYQPGCPFTPGVPIDNFILATLLCDHIRSAALYTESITSSNFKAVECTCDGFKGDTCDTSSPIVVGDQLPITAPEGEYYLTTNSASPFAKGDDGLQL